MTSHDSELKRGPGAGFYIALTINLSHFFPVIGYADLFNGISTRYGLFNAKI